MPILNVLFILRNMFSSSVSVFLLSNLFGIVLTFGALGPTSQPNFFENSVFLEVAIYSNF